ncbi:MAG: hypothetical protein U0359_37395 [Byssovorax sp.]
MRSSGADPETHPTPSPSPASEVRVASAIEHALARIDFDGARLARQMYGDDDDLEIAALAAGTHPLQRGLDADTLATSKRDATSLLAIRS